MSSRRTVLRNIGHLTVGYTVARVLQVIFFLVLSLYYDEGTCGQFSVLLASILLASVLADAGLDQVVTREIARVRDRAGGILPGLFALRIGLTGIAVALLVVYLSVVPDVTRNPTAYLAAVWLVCGNLFLMLTRSALRAFDRMDAEATVGTVERAVQVLAGWVVLQNGGRPEHVLLAFGAGTTVALFVGLATLARIAGPLWPIPNRALAARYLGLAAPFWLSAITVELLHRIDVQMLQWLSSSVENGRYFVAFRVVEGTFLLPQVVAVAALPQLSIRHQAGKGASGFSWRVVFLFAGAGMPIGALLVGLFLLVAPWAGVAWVQAVPVVQVMSAMIPFVYGNYLLGTLLAATDRQSRNLVAAQGSLALNVVLNLILIPPYGAVGAAWSVVLGQALYFSGLLWFSRDLLGRQA